MKRRYLALLTLSYMIVTSVAPIVGASMEIKTDVAAQTETTITKEMPITKDIPVTQDVPLGVGISIIFDDNLMIDSSITKEQWKKWRIQHNGWIVNDNVPVMSEPSEQSEMIDRYMFNDYISYTYFNEKWCCVKIFHPDIKDGVQVGVKVLDGYVDMKYISEVSNACNVYHIPNTEGFKSFMSYKTITDTSSKQYKIQKEYAYTGEFGIRQVNGRFIVAIGTAFDTEVGTYFDLVLKNGEIIPCILGDIKDNRHTLSDNITTANNGCVSEFIVDVPKLKKDIKIHGDISYARSSWDSPVVKIRVYEKNILD